MCSWGEVQRALNGQRTALYIVNYYNIVNIVNYCKSTVELNANTCYAVIFYNA